MKESGVVCKKKKVYLLSLLLFLISYLITVVNMVVNIITGGFHLYIFSILSFMLPCYKSIKTADVFGIVLTILLLLISFFAHIFYCKIWCVKIWPKQKTVVLYELNLVVLYNSNIVFVDTGWFAFAKLYLFVCRRILWKWRVTVHILNSYFCNISNHYRLKANVWF